MTGTWATGWATGDIVTAAEFKKGTGAIYDTTLGVSAASVDITSISNTYAHLTIGVYARCDVVTASLALQVRFNGDAGANYDRQRLLGQAATASASEAFAATQCDIGDVPCASAGANLFGIAKIFVPHYAGSTNNKQVVSIASAKTGTATTNLSVEMYGGSWRSNAAINQITLFPASGNFVAGTRVTVYGMGA